MSLLRYNFTISKEKSFKTERHKAKDVDFEALKDCELLDFSYCEISELSPQIIKLTQLKVLDISRCNLKELPNELFALENLRYLALSDNQLKSLPSKIANLKNLEALSLDNTGIKTLPKEITQLKKLKGLDLAKNGMEKFPMEIFPLKNLTQLFLNDNKLTELPIEIGQLKDLTELSLDDNKLTELPIEIGQLKNLTDLYVGGNLLETFPDSIGNLKKLFRFNANNNLLNKLPYSIGTLSRLGIFNLENNQLTRLPASITSLYQLDHLDLNNNCLQELPEDIGNLQKLTTLYLKGNQVKKLPNSIAQIPKLNTYHIQLTENQPHVLPFENLTKIWDVFISHASEDKLLVAEPLARILERAGLRVWIDKQEIGIGDSIRTKIDEGLNNSQFGVIILSPDFIKKGWTKNELNALISLEINGQHKILPVWHELSKDEVIKFSPILSDRLAANTISGIPKVGTLLIDTILYRAHSLLNEQSLTLTQRFLRLIGKRPQVKVIREFLEQHIRMIELAIGTYNESRSKITYPMIDNELVIESIYRSGRTHVFQLVCFLSPDEPIFERNGMVHPGVNEQVNRIKKVIRGELPVYNKPYGGELLWANEKTIAQNVIILGRRDVLTPEDSVKLRELNKKLQKSGIEVRTYDLLIDAFNQYSHFYDKEN